MAGPNRGRRPRKSALPRRSHRASPDPPRRDVGRAFGLADEGRRAFAAEEAALGLEVVAHILGAMIVAKGKAAGHVLAEGAAALAPTLTDRLQRLETIGAAAGVTANALGRAMIDRDDCSATVSAAHVSSLQGRLTLAGHDRRQVGAAQEIDRLGGDGAVVGSRAARPAGALMRQQAGLAPQPQDTAPAGADAVEAWPRP
jgi:hypothetical protein